MFDNPLIVELLSVQVDNIIVSYPGHEQGKKNLFGWKNIYQNYQIRCIMLVNINYLIIKKPSPIVYIIERE